MNGLRTHHLFKVGEGADYSSLLVKTIRYHNEIDLLTPIVRRSEPGYRLFQLQVFDRLSFIKRAQSLGMSLQEVKEILTVHDRVSCSVEKLSTIFKKKLKRSVSKPRHYRVNEKNCRDCLHIGKIAHLPTCLPKLFA